MIPSITNPKFILLGARFTKALSSVETIEKLIDLVEELLEQFVDLDYSGLYLFDPVQQRLRLYHAKGFNAEEFAEADRTAIDRHPGWVFKNKKILNIPDVEADAARLSVSSSRSFVVRSRLYVPVMRLEHCIGVFGITSSQTHRFNDQDVEILSFVCNISGITYYNILAEQHQRKIENELRLRNRAISASANGVIITDNTRADNPAIYVNNAFEKLTGYGAGEVIGKNLRFLYGLNREQPGLRVLHESLKNEKECTVVIQNYKKDGTMFWTELHVSPVFDDSGKPAHYIGIQNDVTARIQAEEELFRSKTIAEESLRAKEEFFTRMSHEIRTPMNGIIGITNLLLETKLSPDQHQLLKSLTLSADNLLVVINDILDVSKIESGQLTIQSVEFAPMEVLENILRNISVQSKRKDLTLIKNFDDAMPSTLRGDPHRLTQILLNLATNAVKFTNTGSISLSADVEAETAETALIRFTVEDTGIGIPAEEQPGLFQKFFQAQHSGESAPYGSGLGLYIVKQLIDLHKGSIEMQSESGEGTRFTVRIPFSKSKAGVSESAVAPRIEEMKELEGFHILVAEDNPVNQLVIRRTLQNWGANTTIVGDGAECLASLTRHPCNLILMDIRMPVMDGFQATREIRAHPDPRISRLPIIAMTATVLGGIRERVTGMGMDAYVSKPFNPPELLAVILQLLQGAEAVPVPEAEPSPAVTLDLSYFESMADGDEEFFSETVLITIQQLEDLTEKVAQAHEARDRNALYQAAHQLKPIFKMIGLGHVSERIEKLLTAIREDQDSTIDDGVRYIEQTAPGVIAAMKTKEPETRV